MKTVILTTIILLTTLLLNQQSQAQCHIDDWTALKALYESVDFSKEVDSERFWLERGWDVVKDNVPPEDCNLENLATLDNEGRVYDFRFYGEQFEYSIPPEFGNLSNLVSLVLRKGNLIGIIPPEIGKLSNLIILDLSNNKLNGSIPPELGNLNNLTRLDLKNNQLSGDIPSEIGNLTNLTSLVLVNNKLSGSIPSALGNLSNLIIMNLAYNQLGGSIPSEFGNLNNLNGLYLGYNNLLGSIPSELGDLSNLLELDFSNNKLNGTIPNFNSNPSVYVMKNYFTCSDINSSLMVHTRHINQYFTPLNYDNIESFVLDSLSFNQSLNIEVDFPFDTAGFTYQWFRNGDTIPNANQPSYIIDTVNYNKVGKYTLHLQSESCLYFGRIYEVISEPIYVILRGYDLYGQPVEYTQLMVEFEDQATKDQLEQEIFLDNGGIWADKCDCNRELHLYDFPNDSSSIEQAYIALDQKIKRLKVNNEIDGGFNYKLNNIGLNFLLVQEPVNPGHMQNTPLQNNQNENAYMVSYNYPDGSYNNEVSVYLLDSGLDESNFETAANYLLQNAPIDSCYNFSAPGYNFTKSVNNLKDYHETIDMDYKDRVGHGTFGFKSISQGLQQANNAKIVPLKIIEQATEGNLFDLICAMYHAVDHNAGVINISAGYRGESSGIMENALYEAREKSIFVVAAAGNDALNIDSENEVPQYPAYYASQYYSFYKEDGPGQPKLDSVRLDNVISVAAVNINNELNEDSNYGAHSVSIAAPGENIYGHGLAGRDAVGSGTSIAAFLTTQVLAREITRDNTRTIQQIWEDFESQHLTYNPAIAGKTSTGKQINFNWEETSISGCTDHTACNYYPYATIDDGSCYTCVEPGCDECSESCPPCSPAGCTDETACNYSTYATIEDGSCIYDNCGSETDLVICPEDKTVVVCAPVNLPPPLSLEDFTATGNVTLLSALSLQVIQKTDAYKYYNTTTYDYVITDGAGNQNTFQSKYHIANEFLQTPEITDQPVVCQDDLWSYIKLGTDEYKIYGDENGSKGQELTNCNTPGLHCSTSALAVNTAEPGNRQFWVTEYFTFPDGSVCESEATPFEVNIQAKPLASMSMQNISVNIGEGISLMDVVTNNTSGYWTGENIVYLMTAEGENIPYFSANAAGVYKLYYTVSNDYCERSYLLVIDVGGTGLAQKEIGEFIENDYRIDEATTSKDFIIYPNPSSGKLFVELSYENESNNTFTLFDLTGKVLYQSQFEGRQTEVDLSSLAKGMYMIEIQNTQNIQEKSIQKLLIK